MVKYKDKNKDGPPKHLDVHMARDRYLMWYQTQSDVGGEHKVHGLHPLDKYIREGRLPHIWCNGCGLGTATTAFIRAVDEAGIDFQKVCVVSGIGCTGRVAGYLKVDGYHTTHGRAIPFATGLALSNPELKVNVFSGDGDLFAIGGNHFIHAARRNININIICVNNFNYGMTGGQVGPTTPIGSGTNTSPYGNVEHPFNLVHMAVASGAPWVARYTTLHVRRLKDAMVEMFSRKGFCFLEIISPCPTNYGRRNKLGQGLDELKYYQKMAIVKNHPDPNEGNIALRGKIVCGKFRDIQKPTFDEIYEELTERVQGKLKEKEEKTAAKAELKCKVGDGEA